METGGSCAGDMDSPAATINICIKFSKGTIPISISPDSTIKDLKALLQPLTNVLPRGQKLIFKGKVLEDVMKLSSEQVKNGSKIMLMASQGLHQGVGPIKKEAPTTSKHGNTKAPDHKSLFLKNNQVAKSHSNRWKITGVIALSDCCLQAIPDEVWACGSSARVLDISKNNIHNVPEKISCLSSLQKMHLNENDMVDDSISWEGLKYLKSVTVLSLNQNRLTILPSALGALTSLRELDIANNNLQCIPIEIGFLIQLQVLKANRNRISSIPTCIGDCSSLAEVDLSSNLLVELPQTFGNLRNLKTLRLGHNGLKSLPSTLFKGCVQLSTLGLHGTEITTDLLRQFEGWEEFDERRRLKHQKQLDFRVEGSAEFDEGADKN